MPYRRIVVGTDGSARAEQAVREAARLATVAHARLIVVAAHGAEDGHEAEARAGAGAELARTIGVGDVHALSEEGVAEEVLLGAVESHGADLLVVGSKGMTDASRFLLGAVANTISHHATCDVLVVHTSDPGA
jgi:nucleotide-binding universal stress UspA family protein